MSKTVYTTCRYCESNCALAVEVENNRVKKITADKENPLTWQDTCSKGLTAHEIVEHPKRIKAPMKKVGNKYIEVPYEQAVREIAEQLTQIKNTHGVDAIAYYFGNPLGFNASVTYSLGFFTGLGTNNRYNASSIDQNNNHVVSSAMFGLNYVPMNPDVENCDYMLLIGMNPAESKFAWLGGASNGWEKARKRMKEHNAKVIIVDPRRTKSAKQASEHIIIKPGNDWAFLLGIIKFIFEGKLENKEAIAQLPQDQLYALRDICEATDISRLSSFCGVSPEKMKTIAHDFSAAKTAMCLTQTGVSMNTTGTIGHWLGIVLDIITNHYDKKGGRHWEPGYINMTKLTDMDAPEESLSRVRQQRTVLGYRALAELPDEINTPGEGQPKALLIHCGNPVNSGPDSKAMDEAIAKLDLVIAVDLVQRESHRHADWLIPGVHWLERGELNSTLAGGMDTPIVQYAEQALQPPEGVRPEWEFFIDLALAMKVPMLGKPGVNTSIRFTRWLAKVFNKPQWAFNPDMLTKLLVKMDKRVSWKAIKANRHGLQFAEKSYEKLQTMIEGTIQIAPEQFLLELQNQIGMQAKENPLFPFTMIGKRDLNMMNSWLTEQPNKLRRQDSNYCEINPTDAAKLKISDGEMVKVSSNIGSIELPATLTDNVPTGIICIEHGWGSRIFNPKDVNEPAEVYGANKNLLVDNKRTDPFSATPAFNTVHVNIEAL